MQDIFGYERESHATGTTMTSEMATISFGEGGSSRKKLVQSVQGQVQHTVTPLYESGSSDLYWNSGQPMGTVDMERIVGRGGFFDGMTSGNACGELTSVTVGSDGKGGCTAKRAENGKGKNIVFGGAIPVSFGFTFGAGIVEVRDRVSFMAARFALR